LFLAARAAVMTTPAVAAVHEHLVAAAETWT